MNREILFRAWDESNKEMINPYCELKENRFWGEDLTNTGLNTPISVMQFTGLFDKNGTKIFEGDIVAHFDLENKKQIIFKNGAFGYMTADGYDFISYSENRHNFDFRDNKSGFIEVVGNIHENHELLNISF